MRRPRAVRPLRPKREIRTCRTGTIEAPDVEIQEKPTLLPGRKGAPVPQVQMAVVADGSRRAPHKSTDGLRLVSADLAVRLRIQQRIHVDAELHACRQPRQCL